MLSYWDRKYKTAQDYLHLFFLHNLIYFNVRNQTVELLISVRVLILEALNSSQYNCMNVSDANNKSPNFTFTFTDIAANTMLYMFAGYETSATTGQFAAYELARNPLVQERARDEVKSVLAKYGGECTYEAQNEMVYMNMVLDGKLKYITAAANCG